MTNDPQAERLAVRSDRVVRLHRFLIEEAWPQIPEKVRGVPVSRQEREEILGYGPDGA